MRTDKSNAFANSQVNTSLPLEAGTGGFRVVQIGCPARGSARKIQSCEARLIKREGYGRDPIVYTAANRNWRRSSRGTRTDPNMKMIRRSPVSQQKPAIRHKENAS